MKCSFDGIRMNLARSFNDLAEIPCSAEQEQAMWDLRSMVGGILCLYEEDNPECTMLAEEIELFEPTVKELV